MVVTSRHEGRVAIFNVQGRLILGPTLPRIKPRILAALASKATVGLIINLAGVSEIDSSGLGELVSIYTTVMQRGIRMVFAHMHPRIEGMLAVTRLDGVFTVFDTEGSALEYLSKPQVPNQS
jgi:anti-sigma B factor antagonist